MRRVPFLPHPPEAVERMAARKRLELPENAFVVCSFGFLAPTKHSDRLTEVWLASPLAEDQACFLIFVGENHNGEYGKRVRDRIASSDAASRIQITGYVEESQYADYLAAADVAVQLQTASRGETSGGIFACLSRKVPLIVNAHGSAAELPDDAVMKLDESFTDEALLSALLRLRTDSDLRRNLSVGGASHLSREHHPERIAKLYHDVIEEGYAGSAQAREQKLLQAIGRTLTPVKPTETDLTATAAAIRANRNRFGARQILVDVSTVSQNEQQAEIQRTIRGLTMALIANPPVGYRVEPVRASSGVYRHARQFTCDSLGLQNAPFADEIVETGPGDLFLGLDCDIVPDVVPWFKAQRERGLRLVFLVYDMLPLLRPEMFCAVIEQNARRWLEVLEEVADGLVCMSRTAATDLVTCLDATTCKRLRPLHVGWFQPGADLGDAAPAPTGMQWVTWQQSSKQLLDVVLGERWYRSWPDVAAPPKPVSFE